ncbi:hypothetical protein BGZ73_005780 [Actinomortierella ambigua]|nr:hypothetical protein BGZ73_005780 [Actinomortierella ambigua]
MSYFSNTSQRLRQWRRKLTLYSDPYDDYDEYDRSESDDNQVMDDGDDGDEGQPSTSQVDDQQQQPQPQPQTKATPPASTQTKKRGQDSSKGGTSRQPANRGRGRGRGRGSRGRGSGRTIGDGRDSHGVGEEPSNLAADTEQNDDLVALEGSLSSSTPTLDHSPANPKEITVGGRGRATVRGRGRRGGMKEAGISRSATQDHSVTVVNDETTLPPPAATVDASNTTMTAGEEEAGEEGEGERPGEATLTSPPIETTMDTSLTTTQDAAPSWREARHTASFASPIPPKKRGRPSGIIHSHGQPESSREDAGKEPHKAEMVEATPASSSPTKRGRASKVHLSESQKRASLEDTEEHEVEGSVEAVSAAKVEATTAAESSASAAMTAAIEDEQDLLSILPRVGAGPSSPPRKRARTSNTYDGNDNNGNSDDPQAQSDTAILFSTTSMTSTFTSTTSTSIPASTTTTHGNIPSGAPQPPKRVYINEKTKEPRAERLNRQILHMPAKLDKRRSCHLCSFVGKKDDKGEKKQILTQWRCKGCDAHLCLTGERNCFALFHEMKDLAPLREYSS